MSEEQLADSLMKLVSDSESSFAAAEPYIIAGIFLLIILFYGFRFLAKREKDKKINEELSGYYDEYMSSDIDMDFEDYVFCRQNKINVGMRSDTRSSTSDDTHSAEVEDEEDK